MNLDKGNFNKPKFFDILIQDIYRNCYLDYVIIDGVKHQSASTKWNEEKKQKEMFQPPECFGDEYCCDNENGEDSEINEEEMLWNNPLPDHIDHTKIQFIMNTGEFFNEYKDDDGNYKMFSDILINENVVFNSKKEIILINHNGENFDHNGSDHFLYKIPMERKIKMPNQFTFLDLVIALFRLKSHHIDTFYELYCSSQLVELNDKIKIYLDFDHGS